MDLHSKEMFYKDLTLSDIDVVQLLIEYRHKYDKYSGFSSNNFYLEAGEVADLNQEVVVTYASLDKLIAQCQFSKEQMTILELIEQGYELKEIASVLKYAHSKNVRKRLNTILKSIVQMNERNWRKVVYIQKLELRTKKCSKCKENLPATDEFYRPHTITKGGFQSQCKECEK